MENGNCQVCAGSRHALASLCRRCKGIRDRIDGRAKRRGQSVSYISREKALEQAWDRAVGAFRCQYSGVVLDEQPHSPWHITFDHRTPRVEEDVVVCSALVNNMKSDLTEAEFQKVIQQLAERFSGQRSEIDRFSPSHWKR